MKIFTLSTEITIFSCMLRVLDDLSARFAKIETWNINFDNWYTSYERVVPPHLSLTDVTVPASDVGPVNIWITPGMDRILEDFFPFFSLFADNLFEKHRPDIFFLADDSGPFEKYLIAKANSLDIPVVFWMHGSPAPARQYNRPWIAAYLCERQQTSIAPDAIKPPNVLPSGFNGNYVICTNGFYDSARYADLGIPAWKIVETGSPLWDELVTGWLEEKPVAQNTRNKRKVLIVSTGYLKFSFLDMGKAFYDVLLKVIDCIPQERYELYLRLKSGEDLDLYPGLMARLEDRGVTLADSSIFFRDAVKDYDLVLGDVSSALVEAAFLDIPVVRMVFDSMCLSSIDIFNFLYINNIANVDDVLSYAMTEDYVSFMRENIKSLEGKYFYKLDGKSSERIAQVISDIYHQRYSHSPSPSQQLQIVIDRERFFSPQCEMSFLTSQDLKTPPKKQKRIMMGKMKKIIRDILPYCLAKKIKIS